MNAALISLILGGIEQAAVALPQIIAAAQQSGELTEAEASSIRDRMAAVFASPAWQTDAQRTQG